MKRVGGQSGAAMMISTVFALTVFETPIEKIIDAKNASRIFFVKFNILPPSNYILKSTKPEKSMINIKNLYIYYKKNYFFLIIYKFKRCLKTL